ncbi:MAG: DUF881 domain-containing protein [Clostridiaceae bacterium]|nr:DUF881 domain-containing protein [Clostridiaceae bacterium]
MLSVLKRNSLRVTILIILLLTGAILSLTIGFANPEKSVLSEYNIENIQMLTGVIDVEGEGISITLTDNESDEYHPNNIIHDIDLINVVNLLIAAGAEVISVNDERLITTSTIEAQEMMIKINNNEYSSPFIIKAIGNPEILVAALENEQIYVDLLKEHVEVEIEKKDTVFIPRYQGSIDFKYAKPADK